MIAREEIFGPVLATLSYDDEEDAIRIENDLICGLHAAVFSGDNDRAERAAKRLRRAVSPSTAAHSTCTRQSGATSTPATVRELWSGARGVPGAEGDPARDVSGNHRLP
jgi:hypothetical protein